MQSVLILFKSRNYKWKQVLSSAKNFNNSPKKNIRITHADTLHLAHVGGEMFDFQPRAL